MRNAVVILAAVLAATSCKSAHEQTRITAVIGGTLIDTAGATPLADAVIVIDRGRIRAAGPRATTPIPAGSEKIDATGLTIEPGRVETVEQLGPAPGAYFARGVTSVRVATLTPAAEAIIAKQREGEVRTPRVLTSDPPAAAIAAGRPADLVLLMNGAVKRVMLNGEWIGTR